MAFPEYGAYDGLGLGELVRKTQVTPEELLDEAIARAERLNPQLNAIVATRYEDARSDAR
ncbi:MAG: amidase, partial [Candidatus Eremiobacteraeota bacterium]|nr:amidase [Candidatus Eremiobacteraeota bacterium]